MSTKKDLTVIAGLFGLVVFLVVFGGGFTSGGFLKTGKSSAPSQSPRSGLLPITIKSLVINCEVVATADQRKKGLSQRDSLPLDHGMLFVFDSEEKHAIWMKEMKFAIDIMWIDKNKVIVDISKNVAPEPNKKDKELTIYRPQSEDKYILEIGAGLVDLNQIEVGDKVDFKL